jgi:hypothetical protein
MDGTLLSCLIGGIRSLKDGSVSVTLETQELTPARAAELFQLRNAICAVYISGKSINRNEVDIVDKINPELGGKTQGQRIRNTLFMLFSENPEGFNEFDSYYKHKTDLYIEHLKTKFL